MRQGLRPDLATLATALVAAGFVVPVLLGLYETLKPAFGLLPAIGADRPGLHAWRQMLDMPGFWTSLRLTLTTGFAATAIALALACALIGTLHGAGLMERAGRLISPLLAAPHAAVAIGLAFLLAPSGLLVRLVSPWASGWQAPPQVVTIQDPAGLALIAGLVVKELPFFLLVLMAALRQLPVERQLSVATGLGYSRPAAWALVILPQAYAQIRLPIYAALSFSLSVVDVALILGPGHPPPLAVAAVRWFQSPDIALLLPACAAALAIAGLAVAAIGLWRLGEIAFVHLGRALIRRGSRAGVAQAVMPVAGLLALLTLISGLAALLTLLIWSIAQRWTFPAAWPDSLTLAAWAKAFDTGGAALANTLILALATTTIATFVCVLWLEGFDRRGGQSPKPLMALVYLPLVVPQIAFLFGLNIAFLRLGAGGGIASVAWTQALFVLPYVMLALSDPWRALDRRYARAAASLGASPWRILVRVKLPLLAGPLATAAAIGFSVSVAQYLATLFIGAGRVPTLTTEAVALSSGGDRRLVGVHASLQALLPLVGFVLAAQASRLSRLRRRPSWRMGVGTNA